MWDHRPRAVVGGSDPGLGAAAFTPTKNARRHGRAAQSGNLRTERREKPVSGKGAAGPRGWVAPPYSALSDLAGSTAAARRAGSQTAIAATPTSRAGTVVNATGSSALTP